MDEVVENTGFELVVPAENGEILDAPALLHRDDPPMVARSQQQEKVAAERLPQRLASMKAVARGVSSVAFGRHAFGGSRCGEQKRQHQSQHLS